MEKLGKKDAEAVDWSAPRLICIAGDFNRYDDHAVKQIQRNIELIRYRRFGADLLMLDLLAATSVKGAPVAIGPPGGESGGAALGKYKTISAVMEDLDAAMIDRFEALRAYLMALGDDVQETILQFYIAFKRIKNFACVEFRPTTARYWFTSRSTRQACRLSRASPAMFPMSGISALAISRSRSAKPEDLERAMPLIKRSYEES